MSDGCVFLLMKCNNGSIADKWILYKKLAGFTEDDLFLDALLTNFNQVSNFTLTDPAKSVVVGTYPEFTLQSPPEIRFQCDDSDTTTIDNISQESKCLTNIPEDDCPSFLESREVTQKSNDEVKSDQWVPITHKHKDKTNRKKVNMCYICGSIVSLYSQHMAKHKGPVKCNLCGLTFSSRRSMSLHMQTKHVPNPRKFVCTVCGSSLASSSALRKHMYTHGQQKHHQCHYCPKSFGDKYNLQQHVNVHTMEIAYNCKYCDKKFLQVAALIQHTRVHTGYKVSDKKKQDIADFQRQRAEEAQTSWNKI